MVEIRRTFRIVRGQPITVTYRQLQREIGSRLTELRRTLADNLSPEDLAPRAKERGLHIGARTIRQLENGTGNPSVDTLYVLLTYYGVSLGEFFRFTIQPDNKDASLVDDFKTAIKLPRNRRVLSQMINVILGRDTE